MIRLLTLAMLLNFSLYAENCITYQNMQSTLLDGELLEVKGTRYWDHGEEIKYYIFRLKNETCFDDGYGLIDADEIQVLLNDEQIKNINAFLNKTIRIQIDDFLWGGTQQWKRSIGVTRARFYLN